MPARSERIYLCSGEDGEPIRVVKFPAWWDRREFFERFWKRRLDTRDPAYVDYGILLTYGEAYVFDRECRETFVADPRDRRPVSEVAMQRWDSMLKGTKWVIVESCEWESGLG